jgi:hypothetical protein
MSGKKGSRPSRRQPSDPAAPENLEALAEGHAPGNGAAEESAEAGTATATAPEEPAQVAVTMRGTDKAVRRAAKRFGEGEAAKPAPSVMTPANDPEPPKDNIAELLADGNNVVYVQRQKPREITGPNGEEVVTNLRLPRKYECPTSKQEIEELVFEKHGGSKYKCIIYPDVEGGLSRPLGNFTIEHPDPKVPPFIDGVTVNLPSEDIESEIPAGTDPTARETDPMVKMKEALQRRLERAQMRAEIEELNAQVLEIEGRGKPAPKDAPPAENDEVRKLKELLAEKDRQLSEKKVNDRFDKLETLVGSLVDSVTKLATAPPKAGGEESLVVKMLTQSQQHAKDMIELVKGQQRPAAPSADSDMDKMLDRLQKLQTLTGTGPSKGSGRLSELENRLIDMSWKKLTGGGDEDEDDIDPDDMESVAKLAIKQFAPIAKSYVEKKMEQTAAENGGGPLTKEQVQKIYSDASEAATKKIQDDLASQGLRLAATNDGKIVALPAPKKPVVVPPRHPREEGEVRKAPDGSTVKVVRVKPADLSEKKPAASAPKSPNEGEEEVVTQAEFPGLGPNGGVLKVEIPAPPGDVKYDRKHNVNFILDAIRSDIAQMIPKERPDDTYVIGDAVELLDEEILGQISKVETGEQMESILAQWGDPARVSSIKESGKDEDVQAWLRRLVLSIGDAFRQKQKEKKRA